MQYGPELVPVPDFGRVFERRRRVRLGDASPGGRLRFDALARYLQDVSNDDTRDAALDNEMGWVVRRIAIVVDPSAVFGEELTLRTFCSGTGARWAERRVSVTGDRGAAIEAATLWVHVDNRTGRPAVLTPEFHAVFTPTAAGRTVRARLEHDDPPPAALAGARSWPTRVVDFDVLGHMNNAAYWATVEEELLRKRDLRAPLRAEFEFRSAVEPGHPVRVAVAETPDELRLWLVGENDAVAASAVVARLG